MSRKRPTDPESDRSVERYPSGADGSDEEERCTICESSVPTSDWHPALARYEDGDFEVHLFCSADCRDAWDADPV